MVVDVWDVKIIYNIVSPSISSIIIIICVIIIIISIIF